MTVLRLQSNRPNDRANVPAIYRPIDELYIQPLSPPNTRTVLLPESDNCRAYTPAIHRPTDRADTHTIYHRPTDHANMPTIPITVMPISLRPEHD